MRKKVFGRKLSRNRKSRSALLRSLSREMILRGSIDTTFAKAKALQPDVEKLAMLVRSGSLDSKRGALSMLGNDRDTLDSLFKKLPGVLGNRTSGFTRITKLGARRGDNAEMARIEWVEDLKKE